MSPVLSKWLSSEVPLIIWGEPGTEQTGGYYNYKTKMPLTRDGLTVVSISVNAEDMAGFIDSDDPRDLEPFKMPDWDELMEIGTSRFISATISSGMR